MNSGNYFSNTDSQDPSQAMSSEALQLRYEHATSNINRAPKGRSSSEDATIRTPKPRSVFLKTLEFLSWTEKSSMS